MREKVIDAVFSYNKLIPPKVISVASNIRVASTSVIEDDFTVKESEYVFDTAPSDMYNHSDTHVFGIKFRAYFTTS